MSTKSLMFRIAITLSLLSCSTYSAADPTDQIQRVHPVDLAFSKPGSITVEGQWSKDSQLALRPAGPIQKEFLATPKNVTSLVSGAERIAAVSGKRDLLIFNTELKKLHQRHFGKDITATAIFGNKTAVGLKGKGLLLLDRSLKTIKTFPIKTDVSSIALSQDHAAVVSKRQEIHVIDLSNMKRRSRIKTTYAISDIRMHDSKLYLTGDKTLLHIIDLHTPTKPQILSRFPSNFTGRQLQLALPLVLVANGPGGLVVLNAGEPNHIRWSGSHNKLGHVTNVLHSEQLTLINNKQQRLASLNMDNPELPITGSFYQPQDRIDAVALVGSDAFIAGPSGIERVDFSRKASIQISNEGINLGGSRRAFVQDKLAYVADWFSGLHIYDMSDPSKPRHLSNFHTPGSSKGVVVKDNIAYVGDDDHGLQILDVSDPEQPKKISEILSTGLAYTMKMVGHSIYLADHRGGFHIIDVSDKLNPKISGSYDTPGKSWAIDVSGHIAYVADDSSGLLIFDVSQAAKPVQIGQFNPKGYAEDVLIRDNKAYVVFFDKGLYILDIRNPTSPQVLGHTSIPGNARSISVKDRYAYIAGWESGLQIVDISDPSQAHIAAYLDTDGSAWGLDLAHNSDHVYLWDWWGGVKVIDVSTPLAPKLVGRYHGHGNIQRLSIQGNHLYTANTEGGMQAFDIRNPLNPIWQTGVDFDTPIVDVWTDKTTAYLAAGTQDILRVDISDPFHIKRESPIQFATVNNIIRLCGHKRQLAALDNEQGLWLLDTANPKQAKRVFPEKPNDFALGPSGLVLSTKNRILLYSNDGQPLADHTLEQTAGALSIDQNKLAVAETDRGIHLLSMDKKGIEPQGFIALQGKVLQIQLQKDSLYVATQEHGVFQFDLEQAPQLTAVYPATSRITDFAIHQDAAFFAGERNIHSVNLLPAVFFSPHGTQPNSLTSSAAKAIIPASLPLGQYQFVSLNQQGRLQHYAITFNIKLKKPTKPKFSMEDFKKIMQQKKLKNVVEP